MEKFSCDKRLTLTRLMQALVYDHNTGEFFWNETRVGVKKGKRAGTKRLDGHIQLTIDRSHHMAHRVAWLYMYGEWPKDQIDHRDCNPSNNRLENLRVANYSLNAANQLLRKQNKSGFKGVSYSKDKRRWVAQIKKSRKGYFLGYFDDPADAHVAYCVAAKKLFGEFSRAG